MRTRSVLAGGVAASVALVLAAALPAAASPGGDTTVTFTVVGGGLFVSAPVITDLGTAFIGDSSLSAQLGPVTVTDQRGEVSGSWTAVAASTDFTTGAGTPAETVPNFYINYWSGPAQATTGSGTFIPGQLTAGDAQPLDIPLVAFSGMGLSGANSATWTPTVVVNLPDTAVTGTYSGTVWHSIL